jgi:hypothetical protein
MVKNTSKKKTNLTQNLGVGKGRFKKAIRDGLLLSNYDPDAYECGIKFFNNKCAYCGMGGDIIQLTADHIVPSNQGGRFVKGNIVPACQKCNSIRRDQTINDFIKDPQVLEKIKNFQNMYHFKEPQKSLDDELGENGKLILEQLDTVLNIIRDVARKAIRANERNEILPLEEWVKDIEMITKKYGLI